MLSDLNLEGSAKKILPKRQSRKRSEEWIGRIGEIRILRPFDFAQEAWCDDETVAKLV